MIDKAFDVEARHVDCRFEKLETRLAKMEDRVFEIAKWQYKAIGFLTALQLALQGVPIILEVIRHKS